jgi:Glu-tRNA(Gln) amidotransferase subunit E-like FAD-binding protein
MTKEQTIEIIKKTLSDHNITDLRTQRWLLMKELMANYKGEVDGGLVNEIINEMIA